MPIVFILGVLAIALEDKIKVNKAATALTMCTILWVMLAIAGPSVFNVEHHSGYANFIARHPGMASLSEKEKVHNYLVEDQFLLHLGSVAETLFFVMSSMLIVALVDKYGGFKPIIARLRVNSKRRLLWNLVILSFLLSALLDNLAASIVLLAVLHKLVPDKKDRMKYACMIIISANAGGSWSPIGDVTTLLLWTGGNITPFHQISRLILPSLVNMLVPTIIAHFWLFKKGAQLRIPGESLIDPYQNIITDRERWFLFIIGILSLALVPLFQIVTGLPPFLLVLFGLTLMWIYTDIAHAHKIKDDPRNKELSIYKTFKALDLSTIFFFLGILMSVEALSTSGHLTHLATITDAKLHNPYLLSSLIGVTSSFLDNVALVAATMGMYPIDPNAVVEAGSYASHFVADGSFWIYLAYCAVTGGSLLIIGSATGVTVMGMEKISFGYYFKRFSILALAGFLAGGMVFLLLFA